MLVERNPFNVIAQNTASQSTQGIGGAVVFQDLGREAVAVGLGAEVRNLFSEVDNKLGNKRIVAHPSGNFADNFEEYRYRYETDARPKDLEEAFLMLGNSIAPRWQAAGIANDKRWQKLYGEMFGAAREFRIEIAKLITGVLADLEAVKARTDFEAYDSAFDRYVDGLTGIAKQINVKADELAKGLEELKLLTLERTQGA